MTRYEQLVRQALEENGIALPNWRVKVTPVKINSYNYCKLEIEVYLPRCRKPETVWELPYDMTRQMFDWNDARLVYNRAYERKGL